MASGGATAETVAAAIRRFTYQFADEDELQEGIEAVLLRAFPGQVEREVRLTPSERIDLMVDGVGVECKIAGRAESLARQCGRYLALPEVRELVVVSSRARHLVLPGVFFGGKPVIFVSLLSL